MLIIFFRAYRCYSYYQTQGNDKIWVEKRILRLNSDCIRRGGAKSLEQEGGIFKKWEKDVI